MIKSLGMTIGLDERGSILPLIGVLVGLFCGLLALTFDVGRIGVTHSEMQAYTDHVALAAAGELDGKPDAITRATAAAEAMIEDYRTYGDGGGDFAAADYTLTFYSSLPASDLAQVTEATTEADAARYVSVQLDPMDAGFSFARAFATLTGNAQVDSNVAAGSIAGMTQYACDITPLMFCIPPADPATGALWSAEDNIGQMLHLRAAGNDAWGPGNFGFLDPDDVLVDDEGPCGGLKGAQKIRCVVGAVGSVSQCFSQNGVDTEPGQKVGIEDHAFNVRFDMWGGNMNNRTNNEAYAPAPNVVKGIKPKGGGSCIKTNSEASDAAGLPRDTCFPDCGPYGDGGWDDAGYVSANHDLVDPRDAHGLPTGNKLTGTRWEMYLAEIKMADATADAIAEADATGSEPPPPTGSSLIDGLLEETVGGQCSPNVAPKPERRVIYVASVNCDPSNGGTEVKGKTLDVPVHEYVKIFLTEPVSSAPTSPPTLSIYGEVLGSAGGSGGGAGSPGGTFRDVVQLYR